MNHYSSVIQTVAYHTDRTILAGLEILILDKIWILDDIKWLKYLGGGVETGLFSSLLSVVNDDYRILMWKVCARKWS